ncbi:MAG: Hsp70 family protein, partial [Nitrosarchaeum sp.]|uniref:Hsp70 family protein n=1 Tax=Nitrosarchaeum sp. TaxID=2026886 RepID=UPI002DE76E26
RQAVTNPDSTIAAAKRKMGSDYIFKIQDKNYKPQQISAFILQKIKKDAEAFIGEPVSKAVITVPAYFDDNQRQATKDAGTIAGLDVVRIINEPTAASLAFGLDKTKQDMKIIVLDFGGGTLDVTIMEVNGGVFEVLSIGDAQLSGTDMDKVVINYILDEFKKKEGIDLSKDSTAMARVREAAEKAKIELSTIMETDINLPFISHDPSSGAKNLELRLTRAKLDDLIRPIIQRCKPSIEKALEDAKISKTDVSKIVMVGEPTRIPLVKKFVGEVLGKEPESGIDPMEAVAMGAAIQAGIIAGDNSLADERKKILIYLLQKAQDVINTYHKNESEFFSKCNFSIEFAQETDEAFGFVDGTKPNYRIGIHVLFYRFTEADKRFITMTMVHELLHIIHADWNENQVRYEEYRLANLAGYFDILQKRDMAYLKRVRNLRDLSKA